MEGATNLYRKIHAVMKEVEYLQKDDNVKAGGEFYKAITEEKVTSAVGKAMRKHGLIIYPIAIEERREDMEVVRSSGKAGVDRLATVIVTYRIADVDSGESDSVVSVGTGVDTQDKASGKAQTYAYKYALLRTFAIPTGEDPDRVASDQVSPAPAKYETRKAAPAAKVTPIRPEAPAPPPPSPPAGTITAEQKATIIREAIDMYGADVAKGILQDILQQMNLAHLQDLKASDYEFFRANVAQAGTQPPLPWG